MAFVGAQRLAEVDKFQFPHWARSLIGPLAQGGEAKGADRGVDGLLYFYESKDERRKIIVQLKGGSLKRGDVATLPGDVNNQKAADPVGADPKQLDSVLQSLQELVILRVCPRAR